MTILLIANMKQLVWPVLATCTAIGMCAMALAMRVPDTDSSIDIY